MNEREALAILICAQRIGYSQRQHAIDEAGSALSLLADPHAYAHVLGGAGIAAIREAMRQSDRLLEYLDRTGTKLIAIDDPAFSGVTVTGIYLYNRTAPTDQTMNTIAT